MTFSVKMMPGAVNGTAGNYLNAFYNAWRMLDAVPFRVVIQP
jgi:hypothetical protein